MKFALIIFVRNPVLGKVKTRLAATLGNEKALEIYKLLLSHTNDISKNLAVGKYIFYEDFINTNDIWKGDIFKKQLQSGADLGQRMKNAFDHLFKKGYEKIIIIGSDCYELTNDILKEAYHQLTKNDIVVGPAKDGGYYLLGMKKMTGFVFENKKWSTETVYTETVSQLIENNLLFFVLPTLTDVDTEENWFARKK